MNKFQVEYKVWTVATFQCCYCNNKVLVEIEGKENVYKDAMILSAIGKGWTDSGGGDLCCVMCSVNGIQLSLLPLSNTGVNK